MSVPLQELVDDRTLLMPWRVEQYHDLIAGGVLPEGEPYELLDGQMLRKDRSAAGGNPMTVGHEHAWAVKKLARLSRKLESAGCHMQTQQPVALPPHDEPGPDGAVVRGTEDDYSGRHPGPDDVLCVIEVADASLQRDRTVKLRIYADSGIAQYVIINLVDRTVEVYRDPLKGKGRYAQSTTLTPDKSLVLPAPGGRQITVPVRRLLP